MPVLHLLMLWLALGAASSFAGSISGTIFDATRAPVPAVKVTASRAGQPVTVVESDAAGKFRLENLAPGTYSLTTAKTAFAPQRVAIDVREETPVLLDLTLDVQAIASEVTVTADTGRAAAAEDVPQRVNVIGIQQMTERISTVLVDSLNEEAGLDAQRTVPSMGAVAVRGLLGKNVSVFRDGVRYTTSAQRGGVSTFFNLNEATNLDSVEVLRGPNSAQYGSDSLGGTLQMLSRPTPIGANSGWHGEFAPIYSSAAHSFGGNFLNSYSTDRFGVTANLAARRVNTLRPGGGLDSHAAVARFLGLPSTILSDRLQDTAFTQYGGMVRGQVWLAPRRQLTGHYERNQQDAAKRSDQLLGGDGNLVADLRNLMMDFGYLRYHQIGAGKFDEVSITGSYNAQREERVNQGGNGNPAASITHQYERTEAWGASFYLAKRVAQHDLLLGGDGYRETFKAPAFTVNPVTGATVDSRPRIPNGARYLLYGVYVQDSWQPLASGRLKISGALRYGGASYQSRAANSPLVNGAPLWPDDSASANTFSGRIGAVVRIAQPLRVHAYYSRGFRAPSTTDLGTVGLQGNGAYEAAYADLAGRNAFIGNRADDRAVSSGSPVARIQSETSDNYDVGFQISTSRFRAELTGFWINLKDAVVSQTLILPQGAVGQPLGDQTINRQLPTGAVYVPLSSNPVLVRANLGAAQVYGFEQLSETKFTRSLLFAENLTWIYMRDKATGLAPDIEGGIPPLTAHVRLRWTPGGKRFWGEVYSMLADRQDRLSSLALADRRTGATRSRSNIASFFNNGARVRGLVVNGILVPTGENVAAVQNRVLGSANSAPMFTEIPGYGTVGVRGGLHLTERSDLFADFSNVFDQMHRGISWGADGAGRGLTLRYRYQF